MNLSKLTFLEVTHSIIVHIAIYFCIEISFGREYPFYSCGGFNTRCPLPPRMAVVPRSSNVVAEPQLAVNTIHGCIVLRKALRRNKGY